MSADYFSGCMQCRNINILCGADKHRNDAGKYSGSRIWYYVWRSVLFRGDGRQRSGICEFVSQIICILITGTYAVFFAHDVFDVRQTGILVVAGFLCSGVAAVLYTRGIQMTTALNANLIASSEIIMAPIWSYLIFHETIGKWAASERFLWSGQFCMKHFLRQETRQEK